MKPNLRDVIGYLGRDYVTDAVLTFTVAGHTMLMVHAADGREAIWLELPRNPADERWPLFAEVKDLEMLTPPPQQIDYRGEIYKLRFGGPATVAVEGRLAGRGSGPLKLWRYRAAGDRHIQIEEWPSGIVVLLAGEAIHHGMIDLLPGK